MEAAFNSLSTAICMLALLVTLQFTPAIAQTIRKLAQQDRVITASSSGPIKADACNSSVDKAYNLCMIEGYFNISSVKCDCTQRDIPGAPIWECVGTASCKK